MYILCMSFFEQSPIWSKVHLRGTSWHSQQYDNPIKGWHLNYTNLKVPCKQVDWLDPVQIFNMYEIVDSLQYQNEVRWPNFENLFTPKCTLILRKKNNIWCPFKMTSKTCIFDFLSLRSWQLPIFFSWKIFIQLYFIVTVLALIPQ